MDLAVFASRLGRGVPENCCIGAHLAGSDGLGAAQQLLRDSGATVQILLTPKTWYWKPDPDTGLKGPHPLSDLPGLLREEKQRLLPNRILEVKRYRQGYLFERVFPITHSKLVEAFERACLWGYAQLTKEQKLRREDIHSLYALGLRMLCLQVLNHRGLLEGDADQPIKGKQNYANAFGGVDCLPDDLAGIREYLAHDSFGRLGQDVAAAVFGELGAQKEYNFASVTGEMLGPFYQRALMKNPKTGRHDRRAQKESGIFYTSRRVTQTILERLPVEELEPQTRYVLDPTCGSGSFLMAAERRLAELVRPRVLTDTERAGIAQSFIQGNDRDRFAIEVTKLGMVLGRPDVRLRCAFSSIDIDVDSYARGRRVRQEPYARAPSIIVGNPPFKRYRRTEERAALFMEACVDQWLCDGGLMGLVMPSTFLSGGGRCETVRGTILGTCDVLELWDLPRNVLSDRAFEKNGNDGNVSGDIETCAVLLRKKAGGRRSRVFRVAAVAKDKNRFRSSGEPSDHGTVDLRGRAAIFGHGRWAVSSTAEILARLHESPQHCVLESFCRVKNGIKRYPEVPAEEPTGTRTTPWLQSAGGTLDFAYTSPGKNARTMYLDYPGDIRRPRHRWARTDSTTGELLEMGDPRWRETGIFAAKKILVRANMDPSSPYLTRGFIDVGHYPSNNFHWIWIDPTLSTAQGWDYEALLAIVNGRVAQAWVGTALTRNNPLDLVASVPVPVLARSQIEGLSRRVSAILECPPGADRERRIRHLEQEVLGLHGLSDSEIKRLSQVSRAGDTAPWGTAWIEEPWPIHGVVEATENGTVDQAAKIRIRIPGFKRSCQVYFGEVPHDMPGWAVREGIQFEAEVPWSDGEANRLDPRAVRRFRPLPFAYERQGASH